jgi:glutamyl-tRNA reductase
VINKDDLKNAVSRPAGRKLYLYDAAVPRDIDPAVGGLDGIELRDLDGLAYIFNAHNESISGSIYLAEYLAEETVIEYERNADDESHTGRREAEPVIHETGR